LKTLFFRLAVSILVLTFLASCKEEANKRQESDDMSELEAVISVAAGDMMQTYNSVMMPTFFNMGTISIDEASKVPAIILGERKGKGKRVNVNNLGLFSFERDSSEVNFVVSYQNDFSTEELEFETFMVKHHDIKESIESWFRAQCEIGDCRNFNWSNEYKSYLKLNDKKLKN